MGTNRAYEIRFQLLFKRGVDRAPAPAIFTLKSFSLTFQSFTLNLFR
jgi:hypothetical protein